MNLQTEYLPRLSGAAGSGDDSSASIRADFPILNTRVKDQSLVYLDSAATTQKPQSVIDAMVAYYTEDNANVHRGVHYLSQRATAAYEGVREKVQRHINAHNTREIIYTRGTTEAINLVAHSYLRPHLKAGDEVVISVLEHHSNIVPWQLLCGEAGATLNVVPMHDNGELDQSAYRDLLTERTRMVAIGHVSNALGTVNPVAEMIAAAHARDIPVLVDGAQAMGHMAVDVQALDCDFYAFSGHKMYGPTGIGILYGKQSLLEKMSPYQSGGDMISSVTFEKTTFNELPYRFEAGTPNIAGAVGLGAALDYLNGVGFDAIAAHEAELLAYACGRLAAIDQVTLIGTAPARVGVISFAIDGVHPHDIGTIFDHAGVAIRAGHHCAQPVMQRLGVAATARASLGLYNNHSDIDRLVEVIPRVVEVFS